MAFNEYFAELKKIQLFEPQEEADMWRRFKEQDDMECRQQIIERYQPLVFKQAMRWTLPEPVLMDIIQEGTVGLIEAVESYDHRRGVAFSLYALHRIRGRMINYMQKDGKAAIANSELIYGDDTSSLQILLEMIDAAPAVAEQVEHNYLVQQVKAAMDRLPDKEQQVLSSVYLEELEPKYIAAALDMSIAHVYRLQKQGIRRIRGMLAKLMHELKC